MKIALSVKEVMENQLVENIFEVENCIDEEGIEVKRINCSVCSKWSKAPAQTKTGQFTIKGKFLIFCIFFSKSDKKLKLFKKHIFKISSTLRRKSPLFSHIIRDSFFKGGLDYSCKCPRTGLKQQQEM